ARGHRAELGRGPRGRESPARVRRPPARCRPRRHRGRCGEDGDAGDGTHHRGRRRASPRPPGRPAGRGSRHDREVGRSPPGAGGAGGAGPGPPAPGPGGDAEPPRGGGAGGEVGGHGRGGGGGPAAARPTDGRGPTWVLVKGGHLKGAPVDLLFDGYQVRPLTAPRIPTPHTHGTGCTYSAAIAARLAGGATVVEAVTEAKRYVTAAIRQGFALRRALG